jgi:hypothetical protein
VQGVIFVDLPSLYSCSAGRTLSETLVSFPLLAGVSVALPVTVVSFPLFAGVLGGVRVCMTVLVRYAASLHGMAKLELRPLLVLYVLPSCSCVLLHLDLSWRSCLQVSFRSEEAQPMFHTVVGKRGTIFVHCKIKPAGQES